MAGNITSGKLVRKPVIKEEREENTWIPYFSYLFFQIDFLRIFFAVKIMKYNSK